MGWRLSFVCLSMVFIIKLADADISTSNISLLAFRFFTISRWWAFS